MEPPWRSSRSTASHTLHQYCCPTQVLDSMKLTPSGRLAESSSSSRSSSSSNSSTNSSSSSSSSLGTLGTGQAWTPGC
ncbi:uncharacterized protein LOC131899600 [Peromyscus eremicus]|uniref:uncharacterized protein LOC131899600 n=1 Tax=Peromyscus eremicus TaxID=42410 RepID=UPI0027DDF07A|nr:uncharacterized protein LOC131899600 [Peromyscus eremicus]